jgi:hypothetical protein
MEQLFNLVIGAALLLFGRRLYWLFVGGVGFVAGASLAGAELGPNAADWTLLIALGLGLLGALLSVLLQRVLVGVAGFLAGGYLLHALALNAGHSSWAWLAFVIGGVVGALLILAVFDWALIALSALTGAALISQNVALGQWPSELLFAVLLVFGLVVQGSQLVRLRPVHPQETTPAPDREPPQPHRSARL